MKYDVAIIGNGIVANFFARHIILTEPKLKVSIIGPKENIKYNVGESVTELGSHYLQHRLKLTSYLYRNHLFKNGLRFFYDNEDKNLDITDMSEECTGTNTFNTFHLDRHIIEKDIKIMNSKKGIHYKDGAVDDVIFDTNENRIVVAKNNKKSVIRTKWVIDATGRKRFLSKKLGLDITVPNNNHCSSWAHFKSNNKIDVISDKWRRKNRFATREFSTVHFFYPHYWFWVIPLKKDIISCGVVYDDRFLFEKKPPNKKELVAFIKKHKALDGLFDKENIVNFETRSNYSYASKRVISAKKKFALLGDAGAFVDPLYSSGLDIPAQQSDMYLEIILGDIQNKLPSKTIFELAEKVNILIDQLVQSYALLILGKNRCLGSCEIFGLKYFFEFFAYYLHRVWPYLSKSSISDLSYKDGRFGQIYELITNNFVLISKFYKKNSLFFRKNKGWRQFSYRGMFIEKIMCLPINDKINIDRAVIFLEMTQFMLLSQLELILRRKDLLCDGSLISYLSLKKISEYASKSDKNNKFFFDNMKNTIKKHEGSLTKMGYWQKWFKKVFRLNLTRYSGANFSKLKKGVPFYDRDPIYASEYTANPYGMLKNGNKKAIEYYKPFYIEAIAAGLIKNNLSIKESLNLLLRHFKKEYLRLMITGCGYGSLGLNPDRVFRGNPKIDKHIEWFADGYGFSMGLAKIFENREIYFPSFPTRGPLVRGLGRCVTFIPNEENCKEKYEKYFNFFELYPEDKEDYYFGVGFSLAFTKKPVELEKFLKHYEKIFSGKENEFVKKGVVDAINYKSTILRDLYLPTKVALL